MKNANLRYYPEDQYKTQTETKTKSDFLSDFFARLQNAYATSFNKNGVTTSKDRNNFSSYAGKVSNTHSDLITGKSHMILENKLSTKDIKHVDYEGIDDIHINTPQELKDNMMSNSSMMKHEFVFGNLNLNLLNNDEMTFNSEVWDKNEKQTIEIDNKINHDENLLQRVSSENVIQEMNTISETNQNQNHSNTISNNDTAIGSQNKASTSTINNVNNMNAMNKRPSLNKFLNVNQTAKNSLDKTMSTNTESKKTFTNNNNLSAKSINSQNDNKIIYKRSISSRSTLLRPKIKDVSHDYSDILLSPTTAIISMPGNELLHDLEEIFGENLEDFDEEILYNTLEDFNLKMLIRSLIFLAFEQKKKIKELEQGGIIYQKKTLSNTKAKNSNEQESLQNSINTPNEGNHKSVDKNSRSNTHTNLPMNNAYSNSNTFSSSHSKSFKNNSNTTERSKSKTKSTESKSKNNNTPENSVSNTKNIPPNSKSINSANSSSASNNIRTVQRNIVTPSKNMRKSVDKIDKKDVTKIASTSDPKNFSKSPVNHTRASSTITVSPFTNTSTTFNSKSTTSTNNTKLPPKYGTKLVTKK